MGDAGPMSNFTAPPFPSSNSDVTDSDVAKYLNTSGGWLILPAKPPANIDFEATTFGSSTSCRMVTGLCDIEQGIEPWGNNIVGFDTSPTNSTAPSNPKETTYSPTEDFAYNCKIDRAGLNLVGNFSDIHNVSAPYDVSAYDSTNYGFAIVHYTDSTMAITSDYGFVPGSTEWYAALLRIPVQFLENKILLSYNSSKDYKTGPSGNRSITPLFGLLGGKDYSSEWVSGILSCTTTLSDVVRPIYNDSFK